MPGQTTNSPAKILVVDDEPQIVSLLTDWLEEEGYQVFGALDGVEALRLFDQHNPVLSITDLRMPGMDGYQVISRIRKISQAHVLVVTALGSDENIVRGLDLGADEFMVKPLSKKVFKARVRSILRRTGLDEQGTSTYSDSHLTLNLDSHEVAVQGRPLRLSPTEFRLLVFLTRHNDRVVTHHELLESVWGNDRGSMDSVKWHISSLRDKLEDNPSNPSLIVTVPRVGYRYYPP